MQVCTYLRIKGVPITNTIMLATQQERGSDPDIPKLRMPHPKATNL